MTKLFGLVGSIAGSYAGWVLAERAGIFAAFVVSVIGTGVGVYFGRRVGRHYE